MKRVLSLLPSATEIVYALGAEQWLAGVTHECDFPAAARTRPRVTSARIDPSMASETIDSLVREQLDESGSLYSLDMDLVATLGVELVLTQQLCTVCAVGYATVHAAMASLPGPPEIVNLEPRNLDDVFDTFVEVAGRLGIEEKGRELVDGLKHRLAVIPRLEPSPRVLLLEWLVPPFSAGHWMPQLVAAAGGTPVLHDQGTHSRQIAWEQIDGEEFDVLVISCCGFGVDRTMLDVASSNELARLLGRRPELRVIVFDGNHYFSRPGPRLVESAELLHAALVGAHRGLSASSIAVPYRELRIADRALG